MLSGSANALTTYTGFSIVLFNGVAVAALFVLRQREPNAPRPYSAWGYPVVPAIFVVVSALIVANALWTDLAAPLTSGRAMGPSAAGLLIIGLGSAALGGSPRLGGAVGSRGRPRRVRRGRLTGSTSGDRRLVQAPHGQQQRHAAPRPQSQFPDMHVAIGHQHAVLEGRAGDLLPAQRF